MIAYAPVMFLYIRMGLGVDLRANLKIHFEHIHMNSPHCKIVPFHSVTFDIT